MSMSTFTTNHNGDNNYYEKLKDAQRYKAMIRGPYCSGMDYYSMYTMVVANYRLAIPVLKLICMFYPGVGYEYEMVK